MRPENLIHTDWGNPVTDAATQPIRRGALLAATLMCTALATATQAHAETPLEAFCADNAISLTRTMGEAGLDPATWVSNPSNLARFGYNGPGDINTLYQQVIAKGAPYIRSYWSNLNANIQWRCTGQN